MSLELYGEEFFEVFDPRDARQVALFFDRADAEAYLEWRNDRGGNDEPVTEAEWLGNGDEDPGFVGIGLLVSETGELAIAHVDGMLDTLSAYRANETEARSLATLIDAVLD